MNYDEVILNKFKIINNQFKKNNILNNIIIQGNNSYLNNFYLDKLIDILFGNKLVLKKVNKYILIYSCKYYIKFEASDINNDKFIDSIYDFITCKDIINSYKVFIIYNINKFNQLNLKFLKNIIEKKKIFIIGSSNKNLNHIEHFSIKIQYKQSEDDIIRYNIYYNIIEDFYKQINSENFISYVDQLTKQLNKYLYNFTFFIKVCFDFFKDKCDNIELIKICSDAEHKVNIYNSKTIYLNNLIFNIIEIINKK